MRSPAAVSVAAVLWLGCLWDGPPAGAAVALVLLAAAAAFARRRPAAAIVLVLLAMLLLGGGLAGGRGQLREASPLASLAGRSTVVPVRGRVMAEPRATAFGRWTIVRVSHVDRTRLAARAMLQLRPGDPDEVGSVVAGRMRVSPLPRGGFGAHLRTAGAVAVLRPVATVRTMPAPVLLRATTIARRRARTVFAQALGTPRAALLAGLVLGTREGIPMDALRDAGLSHLVVVSGRHVAVLLVGLHIVAAACGIGHRGRHRLVLIGLWWFVLLTRWQPSVLRAAVMATIVVVGALRGRARDTVHTLAVTVSLLLLCDPMLARRAGFALSVLATAGVLIAVRRRDAVRPRGVGLAVRATVGAQIATAPIVLRIAGEVPLAAVPANLVGAPAAMVAQVVGLTAAGLAALGSPGAVVVARVAAAPLAVLEWAASAFAAAPTLSARDLSVIGAVAMVAPAARRLLGRARSRSMLAWLALALGCGVVVAGVVPARTPHVLRLVVVDVGQGDALLVEAPGGRRGARMLVDGGPEPKAIDTMLRSRRIRSLDAVVLTHGDDDHAAGLPRVLRRMRVGTLVVPAGDPGMRDAAASAREALAVARASGVPIVVAHAGQRFAVGSARVEVLAPVRDAAPDTGRNSRSIVLRVVGTHGSMLLTGDVDAISQLRLLARPDRLRATVLKVPHHGGDTNAAGFLDAADAVVAVASVGAANRYGHPHPDTLADLAPVPLWRTDRDGTVTVELTRNGPVVTPRHPDGAG